MLVSISCNCCGSDDASILFPAGVAQRHQIVRCTTCGLMYASPRAEEPEHLPALRLAGKSTPPSPRLKDIEKERIQVRDYRATRREINKLYPNRGRLLEVGSSFGYLVAAFKSDGWDAVGIDPDGGACSYAEAQNAVTVFNGVLDDKPFQEASFDVILMNHVIEHVADPHQMLMTVRSLLKENGYFVMETPTYDSLSFKLLGRRERSLSCNGHIYFFTRDSLKRLCENAGFEVVSHAYVGRSLTANRLFWNLGVMSKSKTVEKWLDRASRFLFLNRIHLYLNVHDMQRICVRKSATVADDVEQHSAETVIA